MASTSFIRIIDSAKSHCPSALEGVLRRELFDVLREFFDRTDAWLFEIVVNIQPFSNDYILNPCQNVIVNRIMQIGRPRTPPPLPPIYLPMDPPQYLQQWSAGAGNQEAMDPLYNIPREAVLLDAGVKCPIMRIRWNSSANEIWVATISLNLSDPTDSEGLPSVPNWIVQKYHRYISDGLISRMMLQPGKPYSSQQGAAYHGRKFNEGIGSARMQIRHMFTYGTQRWSFPQGWTQRRPYIRG